MRLFVAIPIPTSIAQQLHALVGGVPGLRWVPSENYHVTLRFLGQIDGMRFRDIDAALAGIRAPQFSLQCRGVDCFSNGGRIKTLWAGIDKESALQHLHDKVESACVRAGIEPQRHRYSPHVALAYARDKVEPHRLQAYMSHHNLFRSSSFAVTHFILYSSRLGSDASVYRAERTYELRA